MTRCAACLDFRLIGPAFKPTGAVFLLLGAARPAQVTKLLTFVAEPGKIPVVLSPEEMTRFLDPAPGASTRRGSVPPMASSIVQGQGRLWRVRPRPCLFWLCKNGLGSICARTSPLRNAPPDSDDAQLGLPPARAASTSSQDWKRAASVNHAATPTSSIRKEVGYSSSDGSASPR